jgi:hypothetical protein
MRSEQTLDGLFEAMRDERAVADGAIAQLVETAATSSAKQPWPPRSLGLGSMLATLGASILVLVQSGQEEPRHGSSAPTVASPSQSASQSPSIDVDTNQASGTADLDSAEGARGDDVEIVSNPKPRERARTGRTPEQHAMQERGGLRTDAPAYDRDAREKWKTYLHHDATNVDQAAVRDREGVDVEGSTVIRLRQRDLAAIGVSVSSTGVVECYARSVVFTRSNKHPDAVEQEDTRLSLLPERGQTTLISTDQIPDGVEPTVLPEMITDGAGYAYLFDNHARRSELPEHVLRMRDSIERRRLARPRSVNALIPVHVRGASLAIDGGDDNDIVLWYRPDPRLIVALPPCLREQLLSELDSVARGRSDELVRGRQDLRAAMSPALRQRFDSILAAGRRNAEPCSEPVVGRPLLDIWRSSAGAITAAQITPNTIEQTGQLTVDLTDERIVQVWLHTVDGARLRRLANAEPMSPGRSTIAIDAAGVPTGVYLMVVVTDRGERATLRVIVQ